MRRIAIALAFLLGACAEKPQEVVDSISWTEHRSLGVEQQGFLNVEAPKIDEVRWSSGAHALSATSRQIPDLADPAAFDGSKLGNFKPADSKSLSATGSSLSALTGDSRRVTQLAPVEASSLGSGAKATIPAEWL